MPSPEEMNAAIAFTRAVGAYFRAQAELQQAEADAVAIARKMLPGRGSDSDAKVLAAAGDVANATLDRWARRG